MNRIDNIRNYANKRDNELEQKKIDCLNRIDEYKNHIKKLKPRIDELLKVGNACLEHGIALIGGSYGGHEGYDTHQFISNMWSHLTGFIYDKNGFKYVGKIGGGACDYELRTNGDEIIVSGNVEFILKRFIEDFDKFEDEFYKYVDNITK